MDGLHLSQKCFPSRTDVGIRSIVDVLAPELSQLYCVTHKDFLMYSSPEGKSLSENEHKKLYEEYNRFLLEEFSTSGGEVCDLKLFDRGFLLRLRDYLYGDWTSFHLLSATLPLTVVQPWTNKVPPECEIFISCVDGAYWEVFARDISVLPRIKERFPEAERLKLENKTV